MNVVRKPPSIRIHYLPSTRQSTAVYGPSVSQNDPHSPEGT